LFGNEKSSPPIRSMGFKRLTEWGRISMPDGRVNRSVPRRKTAIQSATYCIF